MTRWLMFGLCMALPAAAGAKSMLTDAGQLSVRDLPTGRVTNLRLIDPGNPFPSQTRRFGLIVEREVGPNAQVGVGLMNSTKRPAPSDWRLDRRASKSRKLGVSFQLQF